MKRIRVLIADDHDLVRAGLRSLLTDPADIEVVAEACNGREALAKIEEHCPHVVLMDIMMPEMNGLDATALVAARFAATRVLILSMNATAEYVQQAIRSGASGYLLKDTSPDELVEAIRNVAKGEVHFSPAIGKLPSSSPQQDKINDNDSIT